MTIAETGKTICLACPHPRAGHGDGFCRFSGCHCGGFSYRTGPEVYPTTGIRLFWDQFLRAIGVRRG